MRKVLVSFLFLATFASILPAEVPVLRSLAEINAFLEDATPRKTPFELIGRTAIAKQTSTIGEIILADEDGNRAEFYRPLDVVQPTAGETIRACGIATISQEHEPYLQINDFEVLATGPVPEPTVVRLSETNAKRQHLMSIRTEGVVIDVYPDEVDHRYSILLLKDEDVVVPVSIPDKTFGDCRNLIDAKIRVTGIYHRSVGGRRKYSWPIIIPSGPDALTVLTPAPRDPFSAPAIENRLYLTSEEIGRMSKRSAHGEVLATWSRNQVMLRMDDRRITNLTLAKGETLPPCGARIVAAGQPETDLFRINLASTRWKADDGVERAAPADDAEEGSAASFWEDSGRNTIRSDAHGKLITLRGTVRTLPSPDDTDIRIVLDTGDLSIPVDVTSHPDAIDGLEIGCEIRLTGRCVLLTDTRRQNFTTSRIKGFALVIRSPDDIAVLRRPSWWTLPRLTIVISVLLAALTAIYIWNRILRNLANRRGRELYREQVAHAISEFKTGERTRLAVELHDSLSQTLAGVACHLAVGAETYRSDPETAVSYLETARKMLNSCRTELRQCLFDLRSDTLEEPDFAIAIRKTLNQIDGDATFLIDFDIPRRLFHDTTAHALLAIIRELAGNAIRHGKATEVTVIGHVNDGNLSVTVSDNGEGFDPAHCNGPQQGHFGLEGIRTRLEKLDGAFTIDSSPGTGTRARLTIPQPATKA